MQSQYIQRNPLGLCCGSKGRQIFANTNRVVVRYGLAHGNHVASEKVCAENLIRLRVGAIWNQTVRYS